MTVCSTHAVNHTLKDTHHDRFTLPELTPVLKQLRLSGLLESLDTRNREAIQSKLTYPEFLALVIQDEAERREQKKYAMRLRRAGFRGDKTLEGFDFDFNPSIDQRLIHELAQCRFIEEKVALLIAGPCGTGKSHIAQALGHCAVRKGYDVMFTTQTSCSRNSMPRAPPALSNASCKRWCAYRCSSSMTSASNRSSPLRMRTSTT